MKGLEISLEQILGEGFYSDPQGQAHYDEHTLALCSTAALNARDRSQEPGNTVISYLWVKQGQ